MSKYSAPTWGLAFLQKHIESLRTASPLQVIQLSDNFKKIEVALFPIPNVVAFPGTILPLHVFEPRYRQLIHDCVSNDRMVGVCHTVKTIHKPAKRQTLEQNLSSNQATYKPREVFSAGPCEIVETTSDGRILATIAMSQRLSLIDEIQSLPYRIVSCIPVQDEEPMTRTEDEALQKSVNSRLIDIVKEDNSDLASELEDARWAAMDPGEYSFNIFQFLRFEADIMQLILETQSANTRLEIIWDLLRSD